MFALDTKILVVDDTMMMRSMIKKTLTGSGRAVKAQMQMAVKLQLKLTSIPEPHDVADALAVAICSHHLERFGPLEERKIG